jgi:tetratricopeptide (TPR) repeat protein
MIRKVILILLATLFFVTALSGQQAKSESPYNLNEIMKYYKTKNFDKTKEMLELWLAKSPQTFPPGGFLLLGNIYDHLKVYPAALQVYEKGLSVAENKFPFLVNIAQVYRHMDNHQKAIETLEKIRDKGSFYPEIYLFLGMSYFESRNRLKTIEVWERFVDLKPPGPKTEKVRKALAWLKQKDFKWPEDLEKESKEKTEELKKFLEDLKKTVEKESEKDLKGNPEVKEEELEIQDKGKEEGEKFDEIER